MKKWAKQNELFSSFKDLRYVVQETHNQSRKKYVVCVFSRMFVICVDLIDFVQFACSLG